MDWQEIVEATIPAKKELSILEFGLGDGTEYLLDNFKFVYSHELIRNDYWYQKTVERFKDRKNWEHQLVLFDDIGFVDYNPNLPADLIKNIDELMEDYKFDVVFIDGDYHVRGDIANHVFRHMPRFIIIHDTNFAWEEDGYDRMLVNELYTKHVSKVGEGTHIYELTGYL